ncbi:hypothetical protein [Thermoflexus sp.]|uniref:hypothetical protein n=1 Tax=Thermoflexus sp. TaxID=1969742 RepID=UPI0035E435CF
MSLIWIFKQHKSKLAGLATGSLMLGMAIGMPGVSYADRLVMIAGALADIAYEWLWDPKAHRFRWLSRLPAPTILLIPGMLFLLGIWTERVFPDTTHISRWGWVIFPSLLYLTSFLFTVRWRKANVHMNSRSERGLSG